MTNLNNLRARYLRGAERFIYTYACHDNERELCLMELRALFGKQPTASFVDTNLKIVPDRSPFISLRLDVLFTVDSWEALLEQVSDIRLPEDTFKVVYIKNGDPRSYDEQRELERQVGGRVAGKAEMRNPDVIFGLFSWEGRWMFGVCRYGESVWLQHKNKPQNYSTGLSTAVARALVNIAVPNPQGIRVIDPCCGMGNVLIEALSMGIDIIGVDINPLAVRGARINLRHFGYPDPGLVTIKDMNEVEGHFDAAIVDMPYNLCSVLTSEQRGQMLTSLRQMSARNVIVSTEQLEPDLEASGMTILDRCTISKGSFVRNVWLT